MNDKKCVKLDLYIDDEEVLHQSNDESADEVLCLRILSSQTKYRFGGLKVHIESPVFNIGKIFNVEFDEDSEVALIKSQKEALHGPGDPPTEHNTPTTSKAATIVISPDREELALTKCPTVSADLTLVEATDTPADLNGKDGDTPSVDESGAGGRRMSSQMKKFMSKKLQSSWNNAVRVKRFFSDSMQFWN
ncbi:unnamed protein product [Oppiella nova]|uniref:Uncharacterized protein n=1 Tax=Oppiella nova TaxID=334625 RepID=A0A7R9MIV2_9ACAR|nr:unnamed protein product [Oppiella nova]CAG2178115.1 unnamed protein product [Oppiella nova]